MGALILPPSGYVYVDANTVIYTVEQVEPFRSFLAPLWAAVLAGDISIVTSELTWLETLVKPMRDRDAALEALYRSFLSVKEVRLLPATLPYGNRLPGCVV